MGKSGDLAADTLPLALRGVLGGAQAKDLKVVVSDEMIKAAFEAAEREVLLENQPARQDIDLEAAMLPPALRGVAKIAKANNWKVATSDEADFDAIETEREAALSLAKQNLDLTKSMLPPSIRAVIGHQVRNSSASDSTNGDIKDAENEKLRQRIKELEEQAKKQAEAKEKTSEGEKAKTKDGGAEGDRAGEEGKASEDGSALVVKVVRLLFLLKRLQL